MKEEKLKYYEAPTVSVVVVKVEYGFATSSQSNDRNGIHGWTNGGSYNGSFQIKR